MGAVNVTFHGTLRKCPVLHLLKATMHEDEKLRGGGGCVCEGNIGRGLSNRHMVWKVFATVKKNIPLLS